MWVDSAWLLRMAVLTMVVIRYGVVAREERYLARKFGEEYRRYKAAVPRWLQSCASRYSSAAESPWF